MSDEAVTVEAPPLSRLAPEKRDELRARLVQGIPWWYVSWVHLAFPSIVGVGLVVGAILSIRDLQPWQLLAVPLVWLVSNATEWRAHKGLLHRRTKPLEVLYDRH